MHRAEQVAAKQSPFAGAVQLVTNGEPGRPVVAHDMVVAPAELETAEGGRFHTEMLSFAVLKQRLPSGVQVRSVVRARNRNWIVQTVSGEDPAQSSWKVTATPA